MPIIVALAIVAGMFINSLFIRKDIQNKRELFLPVQGSKMDMILNMINHSYVDTVDIKKIEEGAVEAIIKDLDPHTVYIPAKDLEKVNEGMTGNFGGNRRAVLQIPGHGYGGKSSARRAFGGRRNPGRRPHYPSK